MARKAGIRLVASALALSFAGFAASAASSTCGLRVRLIDGDFLETATYRPGSSYAVEVYADQAKGARFCHVQLGVQPVASSEENSGGTLSAEGGDAELQRLASGELQYSCATPQQAVRSVVGEWIAPASGAGDLRLWAAVKGSSCSGAVSLMLREARPLGAAVAQSVTGDSAASRRLATASVEGADTVTGDAARLARRVRGVQARRLQASESEMSTATSSHT
jgi:hypothetical protein